MRSVFFSILCTVALCVTVHADSHHPEKFLDSVKGSKDEGKLIYQHFCMNCHAEKPLIPLGAPRFGYKKDWQPRVQQGWKILLQHVNEGFNNMPPRGGCFECSDEQLEQAIITMLPKALSKKQ